MKTNQYTFNEEFYSIPFYVDSRVLVPRHDTEILVDQVLKYIKWIWDITLIDVWTWSSCIPLSISKNSNISNIYALDISIDALEVAKINLEKHSLDKKIHLIKSDLLQALFSWEIKINTKNLIITANLPYIKNWDFDNMDKEVLENEPHLALFWWEKTWFEMYERLIDEIFLLRQINTLNIVLFIEIGFDQYDYSKSYLKSKWLKFEYFKDYNNIYRVIKIEL